MGLLSEIFIAVMGSVIATLFINYLLSFRQQHSKDDVTLKFLGWAVKVLPDQQRDNYAEPWLADLCEITDPPQRLKFAMGLLLAASGIRAQEKVLVPAMNTINRFVGKLPRQVKKQNSNFLLSRILYTVALRLASKAQYFMQKFERALANKFQAFMIFAFVITVLLGSRMIDLTIDMSDKSNLLLGWCP
jgi:hypothetical protein